MSSTYDRLVAALKASADAGSVLHKLILGSYASASDYVMYPDQDDIDLVGLSQVKQKGAAWRSELVPALLAGICTELDRAAGVWANINTRTLGVDAEIMASSGVSAVAKRTSVPTFRIELTSSYANVHWSPHVTLLSTAGIAVYDTVAADYVEFRLFNLAGADLGLHGHILAFMATGGM